MTREGSIRVGDRTITYLEAGDPGGPLILEQMNALDSTGTQFRKENTGREAARGHAVGGTWGGRARPKGPPVRAHSRFAINCVRRSSRHVYF